MFEPGDIYVALFERKKPCLLRVVGGSFTNAILCVNFADYKEGMTTEEYRANNIEVRAEHRATLHEVDKSFSAKLTDGVTECCGYDFGVDQFDRTKNFCPECGRLLWR